MLNFLGLIVLVIPVLGFYIPTYFNLKSKIDDYTETQTEAEKNKNIINKEGVKNFVSLENEIPLI